MSRRRVSYYYDRTCLTKSTKHVGYKADKASSGRWVLQLRDHPPHETPADADYARAPHGVRHAPQDARPRESFPNPARNARADEFLSREQNARLQR